jgi:hypothetical protein
MQRIFQAVVWLLARDDRHPVSQPSVRTAYNRPRMILSIS